MIFFQKLKEKFKKNSRKSEGVITLADKNYFQGLILLYHSIQNSYPVPIVCFDIGLSPDQKIWADENLPLLIIKDIPDDNLINTIKSYNEKTTLAKKGKRQWPLWICPILIKNSPFTKTLWLDCDLVILRNLGTLFKKLDTGPVFTPENLAPQVTANKSKLYKLLPIQRDFNENNALINAGVSGWHLDRDKKILNDYTFLVSKAFEDEDIKNSISWHDQGCLIWAILNNGMENRIATDWKWNLCVKHTMAQGLKFEWSEDILQQLRGLAPEANILHWNGQAVPWSK